MRRTPLFLSLPGSLSSGVVAPDRVLSMSQIELNRVLILVELFLTYQLRTYAK